MVPDRALARIFTNPQLFGTYLLPPLELPSLPRRTLQAVHTYYQRGNTGSANSGSTALRNGQSRSLHYECFEVFAEDKP
jgi:hypothetical protein